MQPINRVTPMYCVFSIASNTQLLSRAESIVNIAQYNSLIYNNNNMFYDSELI